MSIEQAPWSWSSWKIPKTMQLHQCWSRFSISSHHEKICANYSAGTAISGSSLFIKIGSGDHRYFRRRLMWRKKATCRLCRHAQVSGNTVTLGGECFRLCFRKCRHVTSYHTRFMWESHGIPMPWTYHDWGCLIYHKNGDDLGMLLVEGLCCPGNQGCLRYRTNELFLLVPLILAEISIKFYK